MRRFAEHEKYVGAQSIVTRETEEADGTDHLESILQKENLDKAYKRVKVNGRHYNGMNVISNKRLVLVQDTTAS